MGISDFAGSADKQKVLLFYLVCVYLIKKKATTLMQSLLQMADDFYVSVLWTVDNLTYSIINSHA